MTLSLGQRGAAYGAAAVLLVLACPMARAQQSAAPAPEPPPPAPQPPVKEPALDPQSPLAPLPGLGVDWPDLGPAAAPAATPAKAQASGGDTRYTYRVDGIDAIASPLLRQRFDQLSTLKTNEGQPANAAQLDRRAREDAALLTGLLRAEGYYDASVATRVDPGTGRLLVVLDAEPGALYTFGGVRVTGLDATGDAAAALREAFGVKTGDPVNADTIAGGEAKLRTMIGQRGFPFAVVGDPEIVVDHAAHTATLAMTVAPGTARRFGKIVVPAGKHVFDAHHIAEIARFTPGKPFDDVALADLRRALIQTSLVSSVTIKPVPASDPDLVDILVATEPAPPRTIAGELGYGTGEGARAEVSWTHRNLFPPEGALILRGVLGTQEQLAGATYRRNNFHARDRVLTVQATASNLKRTAYEAKSVSLTGSLERQTNIFFQKKWTWSIGGELTASDERDVIVSTGAPRRQTYFIGALPTTLSYDGSDDLLNPTRGFRLAGRFSPEVSLEKNVFAYARIQFDASAYKQAAAGVVVAGRIRLGTIAGAPRDAIAPSRRFYSGGGASVRGYGYQDIGPRDPNNDPIGGRSLSEFSLEARVKTFGNFGVVPFFDGGNIYTTPLPKFSGFRYGAGLGVRYYSNFGPIRIDVGTPVNPQKGDPRVAVYVSLGQAF
ncbi:autotransporter assembly complex family protein [Sphingomonas sp. NFR15]|uniref:autotransporter assembly complex protein TamA n=1 Tax=Sphingomonas sp. NFR15 TaxID=1566282 RepID=UPI00088C3896|nr:autotransporter assembly complex family protein [Sphingomonas sp. NFR15]SDA36582.1 translocation and assembly module TamA [Sphingomonas sp. NFR15]